MTALPAAVLALVGWGCSHAPGASIIAQVGRHNIEIGSFQGYVDSVVGEGWKTIDDRVASRLLDQYLDQEVVAAAARRHRRFVIPVEPGRRAAMIRDLIPEVCGQAPGPSQEAVDRAVAAALEHRQPDRVHVRQIIVGSREQAEKVRRRFLAGEDFAALSRAVSLAPNASSGGELGIITRGTLPEELETAIFRLHPGEISRPVKGPSGYHLFEVLEVFPGGKQDRRAVEATIRQELREDAARRWVSNCIDRLADEVGVRILTDRLWFRYHGRYSEATDAATHGTDTDTDHDGSGNGPGGPAPGGRSDHGAGQ